MSRLAHPTADFGPVPGDHEDSVLGVVLQPEQATQVTRHLLAAGVHGPHHSDRLIMVLPARPLLQRCAACRVRGSDTREHRERGRDTRECEERIIILREDQVRDQQERLGLPQADAVRHLGCRGRRAHELEGSPRLRIMRERRDEVAQPQSRQVQAVGEPGVEQRIVRRDVLREAGEPDVERLAVVSCPLRNAFSQTIHLPVPLLERFDPIRPDQQQINVARTVAVPARRTPEHGGVQRLQLPGGDLLAEPVTQRQPRRARLSSAPREMLAVRTEAPGRPSGRPLRNPAAQDKVLPRAGAHPGRPDAGTRRRIVHGAGLRRVGIGRIVQEPAARRVRRCGTPSLWMLRPFQAAGRYQVLPATAQRERGALFEVYSPATIGSIRPKSPSLRR